MHDLAKIAVISDIRPIPDRDRIVLATVENYDSIVAKDEYAVGDRVVYIFYDSILPEEPAYEFLRKKCWSPKLKGFRIKPMKMGGVISEGLVMPLSILPPGKEYKVGDIVTDDLGIRPYIPPEESGPVKKIGAYPVAVPKSDEENIESVYDENYSVWKDLEFYVTEKVEGAAGTWIYEKDGERLRVFSHNWEMADGVWKDAADNISLRDKMASYCEKHSLEALVLQGEVISAGLQKNIYYVQKADVYFYGMMTLEGERYTFAEMRAALEEMGLKIVPVIRESAYMPPALQEMLEECVGRSVINPSVPREGLVWRTTGKGKDVHFKVKSRPYKVWFEEK